MPSTDSHQRLQDIYVARQPIHDRDMRVYGYEVLLRCTHPSRAGIEDHDLASSQAVINSLFNTGLEQLVGSHRAFVMLNEKLMLDEQLPPMTPGRIVLEIPWDTRPTPARVEGLERLRARGYMIAIDGFKPEPDKEPFLALADIVKLNLQDYSGEALTRAIQNLGTRRPKLLADKIQTHEQFQLAREAGMDYFQGFFFSRPNPVRGRAQQANRPLLLRILETLQDESRGIDAIEQLIVQDATLTYKLLRYINSASYALRRQIDSVREALLLIGTTAVRNWASLILMSRMSDNKPHELLDIALIRARMGETLSRDFRVSSPRRCSPWACFRPWTPSLTPPWRSCWIRSPSTARSSSPCSTGTAPWVSCWGRSWRIRMPTGIGSIRGASMRCATPTWKPCNGFGRCGRPSVRNEHPLPVTGRTPPGPGPRAE